MFKTKRAKSILIVALALVIAMTCAVFLVACNDTPAGNTNTPSDNEKTVTVIVGDDRIVATTNAQYVHDMLVELKEANKLTYEFDMSQYGAFITKMNDLIGTTDYTKWVGVYHNINDVTLYDPKYDMQINGANFHSSSLGVSTLPVIDGASYAFVQM